MVKSSVGITVVWVKTTLLVAVTLISDSIITSNSTVTGSLSGPLT